MILLETSTSNSCTLTKTVVYQGQVDKGEVLPKHRYKETRVQLVNTVASPKWKLN